MDDKIPYQGAATRDAVAFAIEHGDNCAVPQGYADRDGWQHHRDLLVAAVGCDTCEGVRYLFQGRVFTGGGPIPLAPIAMPTRWLAADETRPDARTG